MKTAIVSFAIAGWLALTSPASFAGDIKVNVPSTVETASRREFVHRATRAFQNHLASCSDDAISNVWVFPTHEQDVVFVQYTSGSDTHVAVVELRGDHVVTVRGL
jgi:hypothetical protein